MDWQDKLLAYSLHLKSYSLCAWPVDHLSRIICFSLHGFTKLMRLWDNRMKNGGLQNVFHYKETGQVNLHKASSSFLIKASFLIEDINGIKSSK